MTQKNRIMGSAGPETKNDCAGEGQQLSIRNRKPALGATHTRKLLMRTGLATLSKVTHMLVLGIELRAKTVGRSAGKRTVENKALHIQGSS
jgi:hypothetical protein